MDQAFRMNERTFSYELSSFSETLYAIPEPLFKEHRKEPNHSKLNNATRSNGLPNNNSNNIIYKTKKDVPSLDALASSNYYYNHLMASYKARELFTQT
jgi:hypothetical protein